MAKESPSPTADGLRVQLSAAPHQLTIITEHGLEVEILLDVAGVRQLHQMLLKQREVKKLGAAPAGLADWHYVLAEWEAIQPGSGRGKIHKSQIAEYRRQERPTRHFTPSGRELTPL